MQTAGAKRAAHARQQATGGTDAVDELLSQLQEIEQASDAECPYCYRVSECPYCDRVSECPYCYRASDVLVRSLVGRRMDRKDRKKNQKLLLHLRGPKCLLQTQSKTSAYHRNQNTLSDSSSIVRLKHSKLPNRCASRLLWLLCPPWLLCPS